MNAKELINETVNKMISELKKEKMIKTTEFTAHKKTEQLLYLYPNFKSGIKLKEEKIFEIETEGMQMKSRSITTFSGISGGEFESELDKKENKLNELRESIFLTKKVIGLMEWALETIEGDKHYDIIPLKYWEGKSHEEIAEVLGFEVSTITKNKNRLIGKLKVTMFSDDVIKEIIG